MLIGQLPQVYGSNVRIQRSDISFISAWFLRQISARKKVCLESESTPIRPLTTTRRSEDLSYWISVLHSIQWITAELRLEYVIENWRRDCLQIRILWKGSLRCISLPLIIYADTFSIDRPYPTVNYFTVKYI